MAILGAIIVVPCVIVIVMIEILTAIFDAVSRRL